VIFIVASRQVDMRNLLALSIIIWVLNIASVLLVEPIYAISSVPYHIPYIVLVVLSIFLMAFYLTIYGKNGLFKCKLYGCEFWMICVFFMIPVQGVFNYIAFWFLSDSSLFSQSEILTLYFLHIVWIIGTILIPNRQKQVAQS
jgi:hypothetical protein